MRASEAHEGVYPVLHSPFVRLCVILVGDCSFDATRAGVRNPSALF